MGENFYYKILVLDFFCRKTSSKWEGPYIIEEVYRSGAIKINNEVPIRRWSMDKELNTAFRVRLLMLKQTLSKP